MTEPDGMFGLRVTIPAGEDLRQARAALNRLAPFSGAGERVAYRLAAEFLEELERHVPYHRASNATLDLSA